MWANLVSILLVLLVTADVTPSEESNATMSEREQRGLRGPVKSCTETTTHPAVPDAEGTKYPETYFEHTTEYDPAGRILVARSRNSDGSQWVTRFSYDASGRLLKTASGVEGTAFTETTYSYDQQGRPRNISDDNKPDNPVTFHYDQRGRKTKVAVSRAADYRSDFAVAGSPFEVVDRAPNLPGGGIATTIYDERDHATEVQVTDARGELVSRAVRTYDAQGRVLEEKQIWDNPIAMFPLEARAKILEESGLSDDQLLHELRTQLPRLMADQPGPYSVSYRYDTHGRVHHTNRRIFNEGQEIETLYNEHGDIASEITRGTGLIGETDATTAAPRLPSYSEVRYSYQYDQHENWIEQAITSRSNLDGAFQSSTVTKRTLTYY
jgi:hypothetical protein